jgi:hypothetical protein
MATDTAKTARWIFTFGAGVIGGTGGRGKCKALHARASSLAAGYPRLEALAEVERHLNNHLYNTSTNGNLSYK